MPIDFEDLRSKSAGKGFQPTTRTFQPPDPAADDVMPTRKLTGSGIVKRDVNQGQITHFSFDAADHQERKDALDEDVKKRSGQLNTAVEAYARSRMAQVLADIDIAAASIRANAFDQMGLSGSGAAPGADGPSG